MSEINRTSRGEYLGLKQTQLIDHAHLRLSDKGCAMKGLVVCYVVWLGSMDQRKVRGSSPLLWSGWLSNSSTATPHR